MMIHRWRSFQDNVAGTATDLSRWCNGERAPSQLGAKKFSKGFPKEIART
jgi:hypothetical protein